jgi:hypothetical protein
MHDDDTRSAASPDDYERALGSLDGLPGVLNTKPATIQIVTPVVGTAHTYMVRTFRQQHHTEDADSPNPPAFTVFVEHSSREYGLRRIVLPARVADLIARQRDALTAQARSRTARRLAQERIARGDRPAFLKARRKK